jgi:hypothetical protein
MTNQNTITTQKKYEFIITKLDGQIEVQSKVCKLPLNTSLYTKLLMMWHDKEILKFQIKDKESNLYIR